MFGNALGHAAAARAAAVLAKNQSRAMSFPSFEERSAEARAELRREARNDLAREVMLSLASGPAFSDCNSVQDLVRSAFFIADAFLEACDDG